MGARSKCANVALSPVKSAVWILRHSGRRRFHAEKLDGTRRAHKMGRCHFSGDAEINVFCPRTFQSSRIRKHCVRSPIRSFSYDSAECVRFLKCANFNAESHCLLNSFPAFLRILLSLSLSFSLILSLRLSHTLCFRRCIQEVFKSIFYRIITYNDLRI